MRVHKIRKCNCSHTQSSVDSAVLNTACVYVLCTAYDVSCSVLRRISSEKNGNIILVPPSFCLLPFCGFILASGSFPTVSGCLLIYKKWGRSVPFSCTSPIPVRFTLFYLELISNLNGLKPGGSFAAPQLAGNCLIHSSCPENTCPLPASTPKIK